MIDDPKSDSQGWRRPAWLLLLVASSIAFSHAFACAAPFAAFAAVAACTLPRRDAYLLIGEVWIANQAVGFAFLHYPWTANGIGWGAALGVTAMLSVLAARLSQRRLSLPLMPARITIAFLAAFASYEATLIVFSSVLGGIENFTPSIQGRIFAINAVALLGLLGIAQAGLAAGLAPRIPARGPVLGAR